MVDKIERPRTLESKSSLSIIVYFSHMPLHVFSRSKAFATKLTVVNMIEVFGFNMLFTITFDSGKVVAKSTSIGSKILFYISKLIKICNVKEWKK